MPFEYFGRLWPPQSSARPCRPRHHCCPAVAWVSLRLLRAVALLIARLGPMLPWAAGPGIRPSEFEKAGLKAAAARPTAARIKKSEQRYLGEHVASRAIARRAVHFSSGAGGRQEEAEHE
jgi:hypothetical protein